MADTPHDAETAAREALARLEALSAKATPGPWMREEGATRGAWIGQIGHGSTRWSALSCGETDEEGAANAAFIVDLVNAFRSGALRPASSPGEVTWQPIETARKDRTPYLLKIKDRIPNERDDLRRFDGLTFVGSHQGLADDGFDIGWQFAAPVGMGGFPDKWFDGWQPLPAPPALLSTRRRASIPGR